MAFSNNFHVIFRWNKFAAVHPWKRPWKSVEIYLLGNTWKLPLLVEPQASIASINCSFNEYVPWKLPWASIYPFTIPSTPRVSQTSTYLHKSHRVPFDLLPLTFPPTSTETSAEVNLLPWKLPWNSVKASMEVHGSRWENIYFHGDFYGRWWK